jgi:hypothetical protein
METIKLDLIDEAIHILEVNKSESSLKEINSCD